MAFNNLKFTKHRNGSGYQSLHKFDNGYTLSVVCGEYYYCTPKLSLPEANRYSSFEIAVLDKEDNFCTKDFVKVEDQVAGWISREKITEVMEQIEKLPV
tara:strand:- start:79 stop:375 length:297 start_codon:yes stop_codon:yes gene_type:complete